MYTITIQDRFGIVHIQETVTNIGVAMAIAFEFCANKNLAPCTAGDESTPNHYWLVMTDRVLFGLLRIECLEPIEE